MAIQEQRQPLEAVTCPLAVTLVLNIREAVASVPGVTEQEIEVVGYVGAEELNAMLKESP